MTDKELIERNVIQAKNPAAQMIIEADLRAISPYDIKKLLIDLGHIEYEDINFTRHSCGYWDIANNNITKITPKLEKEVIKLYKKELNDKEIAKKLDTSITAVSIIREKHNLDNWKTIKAKERDTKMLALYEEGLSDSQIAEKLGISRQVVINMRNKKDLKSNITKGRPQKIFEHAEQALELYKIGMNDVQIAKVLNLPLSTINRWRIKEKLKPNSSKGRKKAAQLAL